jgi:peptidyl-tRNA hydrolase, PTH1 family
VADTLIIALGNPGREYEHTRHNIAWNLIEECPFFRNVTWKEKFKGLYSVVEHGAHKIYVLKPQTFMNLSGESVRPMMDFFKIQKGDILVVHDELDLPFGTLGFKPGGGLAGHNGLKSIAQHLGDGEFSRLRLGIGRPEFGSVSNWVLSRFSPNEQAMLTDYFDVASQALECYIEKGFSKAASLFSKKNTLIKE